MKTILNIKVVGTLLACLGVSGCAVFGVLRRAPLLEVRNESVALPPGADFNHVIVSAAQARRVEPVVRISSTRTICFPERSGRSFFSS